MVLVTCGRGKQQVAEKQHGASLPRDTIRFVGDALEVSQMIKRAPTTSRVTQEPRSVMHWQLREDKRRVYDTDRQSVGYGVRGEGMPVSVAVSVLFKLHRWKDASSKPSLFQPKREQCKESQKKDKAPNSIRSGRAFFKVWAWDWLPSSPIIPFHFKRHS